MRAGDKAREPERRKPAPGAANEKPLGAGLLPLAPARPLGPAAPQTFVCGPVTRQVRRAARGEACVAETLSVCAQSQGSIFVLRNRAVPAVGGSAPAHAVHACPQVGAEALPRDRMHTRVHAHRRGASLPRMVLCPRALKVSFRLGKRRAGGTRAPLRPRTAGGGAGLTPVGTASIRVCSSGLRADPPRGVAGVGRPPRHSLQAPPGCRGC